MKQIFINQQPSNVFLNDTEFSTASKVEGIATWIDMMLLDSGRIFEQNFNVKLNESFTCVVRKDINSPNIAFTISGDEDLHQIHFEDVKASSTNLIDLLENRYK